MGKKRKLMDEYRFPGFRPRAEVQGIFGDPRARVIRLKRTQKKRYVAGVGDPIAVITTRKYGGYEIFPAEMPEYTWRWRSGECYAGSAGK
jgi:hypothetical protein